jgi:hypothetical protein
MWKFFGLGFGIICLVVGVGIAVSGNSVMSFCGKGCWLNGLLLALFGNDTGRVVLGYFWALLGGSFIYKAFTAAKTLDSGNDDNDGDKRPPNSKRKAR